MKIQEMIEIDGKLFPHEREMTQQEESEFLRNQEQQPQETKEDLLQQMQILMDKYKALEN